MTARPLETDVLPLVLLAAAAHPDAVFRNSLAARLDDAIEERRPLHSVERLRSFLARQHGTPLEPFVLDPSALEVTVRLLRLAFARRTPKVAKLLVRIVSCEVYDDEGGLVVNHNLSACYLERLAYARWRRARKTRCVLIAGVVAERLSQFGRDEVSVRTMCRTDDGFHLRLTGTLPWPGPAERMEASLLATGLRLDRDAFRFEFRRDGVDFRPATPEAMIRFAAFLPRGERLVLRQPGHPGRVIVTLHDFESDAADMQTVVSYGNVEPWLRGAPAPAVELDAEDRFAIARWAYPPDSLLTDRMLSRLL